MATNNPIPAPFRAIGGWLEKPEDPQPQLMGNVSADAIVIGGGFAGLNTALELRSRGASVVLLEREFAGFGASGRNAGYLGGALGLEYDMFLKRVGHEQAARIVGFYEQGVPYVESRLAASGIECDYIQSGIIRAGVHASQEARLRKDMATGIALGAPLEFLDQAAMRARGIPSAFVCGVYTAGGGTLDPGKYVLGLRRAALRAGVRIYENSGLQTWREGTTITAHTAGGKASAPHLVLATNAYTPQLGLLGNKVAPLRVSAIETEPLDARQLAALDWHGREGIMTPHLTMESFRLTARNTIVTTTRQLNYVYGSRTPNVPDNAAYAALVQGLRERFPMLASLGIRSCWSGYVTMAYDALPVVGETGSHNNVLYTAGCSGHGVATQSLMGLLLAERIMGNEHPLLAALRHKTPSTLPEPLQWCALKSALCIAGLLDAVTNRKARVATAQTR